MSWFCCNKDYPLISFSHLFGDLVRCLTPTWHRSITAYNKLLTNITEQTNPRVHLSVLLQQRFSGCSFSPVPRARSAETKPGLHIISWVITYHLSCQLEHETWWSANGVRLQSRERKVNLRRLLCQNSISVYACSRTLISKLYSENVICFTQINWGYYTEETRGFC